MPVYKDQKNNTITILAVSVNTSGDNTLVSAVADKSIVVTEVLLLPDADSVKIRFKSGANNLTGQMNLSKAGNGFFVSGDGRRLQTNKSEALILNLDAAVTVAGYIHYYVE